MSARYAWIPLLSIVIGLTAGFLISATITYVMPKQYESEAIVQIRPRGFGLGVDASMVERELTTERQVMLSREVLERVAQSLKLPERWNLDPESCLQVLGASLQITAIEGTDLSAIKCRSTDQMDARDIANEVADAYKDYRQNGEQVVVERQLRELNKVVREQEDKVEEARKVLSLLIRNQATANPADSNAEPRNQDITDAKRNFETESELLKTLKLKQITETIQGKIPGESVQIHSRAVVAIAPCSPNVSYNLMVGSFAGFVGGALIGIVLMLAMGGKRD